MQKNTAIKNLISILLIVLALQQGHAQKTQQEVLVYLDSALSFMRGNKDPGRALGYCNLVLQKARKNDLWARAKSYEISGLVYKNNNKQDSAIIHFGRALYNFNKADTTDWYESYLITRNMASVQQRYQLYDLARKYYDSAFYFISNHVIQNPEIAKRDRDHDRRDLVRYYRAQNSAERGDIEAALIELRDIEADQTIKSSTRVRAINYQGILFKNAGMYDSAKSKFLEIVDSPLASKSYKGIAWHNLAGSYYDEGSLNLAIETIDRAIEVKSKLNNKRSLFVSYLDKGEFLMKAEKAESAYNWFRKALALGVDVSESKRLFVIYHLLQEASHDLKLYEESAEWAGLYFKTTEAFMDDREELSIADRKAKILSSLKRFESELEAEKRQKYLEARNRQLLIIAGSILLILGLTYRLHYKKQQRRHRLSKKTLSDDVIEIVAAGIETYDLTNKPKN